MVVTWILPFLFIPLFVVLVRIPYFPLIYLIWCVVTGTIWLSLSVHEKKLKKSGADLAMEYSTK